MLLPSSPEGRHHQYVHQTHRLAPAGAHAHVQGVHEHQEVHQGELDSRVRGLLDDKAAHGVPNHVSSPCSEAHQLDQVSLEGRVVGRTEERRSRERVEAQIVPSN